MATFHLMVGLPCAGKTSLARQLEREHAALRLTPDEWHLRLFGQDVDDPAHDARHNARAKQLGASSEVHFADVPDEELLRRLSARNARPLEGAFSIPEVKMRAWMAFFQRPTPDELERRE